METEIWGGRVVIEPIWGLFGGFQRSFPFAKLWIPQFQVDTCALAVLSLRERLRPRTLWPGEVRITTSYFHAGFRISGSKNRRAMKKWAIRLSKVVMRRSMRATMDAEWRKDVKIFLRFLIKYFCIFSEIFKTAYYTTCGDPLPLQKPRNLLSFQSFYDF